MPMPTNPARAVRIGTRARPLPVTLFRTIVVRSRVEGATLHVDVLDDGVGFNLHAGSGVGLANIRERLALLYGKDAELVIEAPVTGGACVSIRLPYRMTEDG